MLIEPQLKKVEKYFINRKRIQAKVNEAKAERVAKGAHEGGGGSGISDPTASEAMKNVEPIKFITLDEGAYEEVIYQPIEWLELIDEVYKGYGKSISCKALRERYDTGRSVEVICQLHGAGRRSWYDWRKELLTDAAVMALHRGLLKM